MISTLSSHGGRLLRHAGRQQGHPPSEFARELDRRNPGPHAVRLHYCNRVWSGRQGSLRRRVTDARGLTRTGSWGTCSDPTFTVNTDYAIIDAVGAIVSVTSAQVALTGGGVLDLTGGRWVRGGRRGGAVRVG